MGLPSARLGDWHICPAMTGPVPHVGGPILALQFTVLASGAPAARRNDLAVCVGPLCAVTLGAFTVKIVGKPAARMTDKTAHGGMIVMGAPLVMIGEAPSPAGGSSRKFATPEEAARAALDANNPRSIADNKEYGGMIYKNPDGTYGYTDPAPGTGAHCTPENAPIPDGATPVGDYHCHGDYDDKTGRTSDPNRDKDNSDGFSDTDEKAYEKANSKNPGYKGYLGTPSGQYKQYDPNASGGKWSNM